jgi:hypothetical protein
MIEPCDIVFIRRLVTIDQIPFFASSNVNVQIEQKRWTAKIPMGMRIKIHPFPLGSVAFCLQFNALPFS